MNEVDVIGIGLRETDRVGDWLCTFTGRKFYPLDPRPQDFCIEDIAHALSNTCRFGGHSRRFYSVGEHSYRVLRYVENLPAVQALPESFRQPTLLYALFHDASEAYICDIPRPLKRDDCMSGYRVAEGRIMDALCRWLGIRPTLEIKHTVWEADQILLYAEAGALMPAESVQQWHWPAEIVHVAQNVRIPSDEDDTRPWLVETIFTAAYERLMAD